MKTTKWFASISLSGSLGFSLAGSYACSLAGFLAGSLFFCSLGLAAPGELKFASLDDSQAEFDRSVKPVLAKFCSKCHGSELQEKDLNLQTLSPDMKGTTSAARWAVVLAELSLGKMPPKGEAQPSA